MKVSRTAFIFFPWVYSTNYSLTLTQRFFIPRVRRREQKRSVLPRGNALRFCVDGGKCEARQAELFPTETATPAGGAIPLGEPTLLSAA